MKESQTEYFRLFLRMPAYIVQWWAHHVYELKHKGDTTIDEYRYNVNAPWWELEEILPPAKSTVRQIILDGLTKSNSVQDEKENSNIAIAIPWFAEKDVRVYNRLLPEAQKILCSYLKNKFNAALEVFIIHYAEDIEKKKITLSQVLILFMSANGIDPEYYEQVAKSHRRIKNREYAHRFYQKKNN